MDKFKSVEEAKDFLSKQGYTNLRVETKRENYILADKDGRTFVIHPYQYETLAKR